MVVNNCKAQPLGGVERWARDLQEMHMYIHVKVLYVVRCYKGALKPWGSDIESNCRMFSPRTLLWCFVSTIWIYRYFWMQYQRSKRVTQLSIEVQLV